MDPSGLTASLRRKVAEKVLARLDAERMTGAVVLLVKELFTTTETATMLGLSRPSLMKLIESGEIGHVKIGTHHRVPAQAVLEFQRARARRREQAAAGLGSFSTEIGLAV